MSKNIIKLCEGTIFGSNCEALVNPVNCDGVMGAGLAKAFADRYPSMEATYQQWCREGRLRLGKVQVYTKPLDMPIIINFPTKDKVKNPSTLDIINASFDGLEQEPILKELHAIAFPALGCGLGGLKWKDVKPVMIDRISRLNILFVEIYLPKGRRN